MLKYSKIILYYAREDEVNTSTLWYTDVTAERALSIHFFKLGKLDIIKKNKG